MKKVLFIGILFLVFFINGCEGVDTERIAKEIAEENIDKLVVCDSPYIRHGSDCCLDQNENNVCDNDEKTLTDEEPKGAIVEEDDTISCSDECSNDGCDGFDPYSCIMQSDGCKDKKSEGIIQGECGVICLINSDCADDEECNNYQCEKREIQQSLTIQSDPSGASVWIDGKDTRFDTPHTFIDLEPGDYDVEVRLVTYEAVEKSIKLSNGDKKVESFTLSKIPSNLIAILLSDKLQVNSGEEFTLDATGSGGGYEPVTWKIEDSMGEFTITNNDQTLGLHTVSLTNLGQHAITLSMTDYKGSSTSSSVTITVSSG
tara:strand:+ start:59 stop:1006 length:948 start_codon:yes stop_codon:yes gene_type:complete